MTLKISKYIDIEAKNQQYFEKIKQKNIRKEMIGNQLKQKNQSDIEKQFQLTLEEQKNILIFCDDNYFYKFSQEQNNLHKNEVEILQNFIIPLNNSLLISGKNSLFAEYFLIGDIIKIKQMQMDLQQFLSANQFFTENLMKQILQQILIQIAVMHSYQLTHGDIKPSNILVNILPNNQIEAKLIDFQTCSYHNSYLDIQFKPKGYSVSNTPICYQRLWKNNIFSKPYNPFDMDLHQVEILLFQLYSQVANNSQISKQLKDFINFYPYQKNIFQILSHKWIKSSNQ